LKELIRQQISRFSSLNLNSMSFPESLEERFEADTSIQRCSRLWAEGLISIFLFDLFLVADHLGTPDQFLHAVIVRLGIITPLALAVNMSMLRRPNKVFREASIAAVACLAGLTHLYLESNIDPVTSAFALFGIVAVVLFANTSMRLRVPYAWATSATMSLGGLIFLNNDHYLSRDQKMVALFLTLSTMAVTVIANLGSNREERLSYLYRLEGEVLVGDLNQSNQHLTRLAERDALTGLANRHSFDRTYSEYWESTVALGSALSLIVIDVDHFKKMNDRYGHPYGDQVLKRIANLLVQGLRVKEDFAARVGGEEFVVLLPATPLSAAVKVAERIRTLVEVAGFPPISSQSSQEREVAVTVSCGVATASPTLINNRDCLFHVADKALYKAKAQGRNLVCCG
jgi:diguanylate cyclase (GGDEF)-like protein